MDIYSIMKAHQLIKRAAAMTFHEDNNSVTESSNQYFYNPKIAYPEDIPLLEAYDEQSFTLSDGMFHIEEL